MPDTKQPVVVTSPKDILSIEFMGVKIFEKKSPVIESKFIGIPLKYILGGYLICKMLK